MVMATLVDDQHHPHLRELLHRSGHRKGLPSRKIHEKMIEDGRQRLQDSNPRRSPRSIDKVPARKAGTGTYHIYRNLFWGLIKAVEEGRRSRDQAISLMQANSPS